MAGQIGPKFCVKPQLTPLNVDEWSNFKKLASNKIRFSLNFENPRGSQTVSSVFVLLSKQREMFTIEIEDGRGFPSKPSSSIF